MNFGKKMIYWKNYSDWKNFFLRNNGQMSNVPEIYNYTDWHNDGDGVPEEDIEKKKKDYTAIVDILA